MIERIVIAGGGTGGHLFPGISVWEELRRREPSIDALFVGTERGIESRVIPAMGEKLRCIEVRPLKGRTAGQWIKNMAGLPMAGAQALSILRDHRPDLVLGVGGYAAGPLVAAAAARGIPTALLEQNAHVGLTNRLLSKLVGRAYLTYDQTAEHFPADRVRVVGNPIRRSFVEVGRLAQTDPAAFEMRARRILVMGGSQGAQALNETVPDALAAAGIREGVVHQAGKAMLAQVRERYAQLGIDAQVVPFIDDMARAYSSAGLIIARAGATTLAELCAVGRPSILIPFPHAADDHQWHNAHALEQAGASIAIRQSDLTVDGLAEQVRSIWQDRTRRTAMADAARALGRPDAAAAVVDDLCDWLGWSLDDPEDEPLGEVEEPDPSGHARRVARLHAEPGMRRGRTVRRPLAWDHANQYFGYRPVAVAK